MTRAFFEMNMANTQMNKALYFMKMATKMTLPQKFSGFVVYFGGNLITFVHFIIFVLFTLPLSILDMS